PSLHDALRISKKSRAASGTPEIANDPRCPSGTSFKYISRISSFDARRVRTTATHISRILRLGDFRRAVWSVHPANLGRNTLRTSCCVIVLPPDVYALLPRRFDTAAP